jgi:hypothetical protein
MFKKYDNRSSSSNSRQSQVPNFEALRKLESAVLEASAIMDQRVENEDVIICLGSTRGGKSTLVNYIIGNKLKVNKEHSKYVLIKEQESSDNGPIIGLTSTSETLLPSRWLSHNGKVVWDAPGFDDTRGEIQDITNAFYIKVLLKGVKSAKLVLVTDYNEISVDNVTSFIKLLDSVKRIFKEQTTLCVQGISLIFTKVPKQDVDENIVDKPYLCDLLQQKILYSKSKIDDVCRNVIKFLVNHPEHIGIFRKAKADLEINALNDGIETAINAAIPLSKQFLGTVSPSVSEKSQNFLWLQKSQLSGMQEIGNLLSSVEQLYEQIVQNLKQEAASASEKELNKVKDKLIIKLSEIEKLTGRSEEKLLLKLEQIRSFDCEGAGKLIKDLKLINKAKFIEFVDGLLEINESGEFNAKLNKTVVTIMKGLESVNITISEKLGEINKQQAKELASKSEAKYSEKLKQQQEQINKLQQENTEKTDQALKKLGFFGHLGMAGDVATDNIVAGAKAVGDTAREVKETIKESCIVQSLFDVKYDNPFLNDSKLLQLFLKTYGANATSYFIDITNILIRDSEEGEISTMLPDSDVLTNCGNLIGQSGIIDFSIT